MHETLQYTPNIEFLIINAGEVCRRSTDYHWGEIPEIEELDRVSLQKLKYLKITNYTNFSDCSEEFLQFIEQTLIIESLETLILDQFSNIDHVDWIENMISKHSQHLKSFYFSGPLCLNNCELFQKSSSSFNGTLTALEFNVMTTTSENQKDLGLISIKNLINNSADTLEYFATNMELTRSRKLFKGFQPFLKNVRVLSIKLGLGESIVSQVSLRFLNILPRLNDITLDLNFGNRNVCKSLNETVKITNLKRDVELRSISRLVIKADCKLEVVKGWHLLCRNYSFQNLNAIRYIVVINATDYNQECKKFWDEHSD
jgi:hypothetical protein